MGGIYKNSIGMRESAVLGPESSPSSQSYYALDKLTVPNCREWERGRAVFFSLLLTELFSLCLGSRNNSDLRLCLDDNLLHSDSQLVEREIEKGRN